MEPEARAFLERACAAAERYDHEGRGVLPVECWPMILDDLGIKEGSDPAYFLMDHLEGAGEGHFTYIPLKQGLGGMPPRGPPPGDAGERPPYDAPPTPPRRERGGDCSTPVRKADPDTPSLPESPVAAMEAAAAEQYARGSPARGADVPPLFRDEGGDTVGPLPGGFRGGPPREQGWGDGESVACNEFEEINEAFWAKRASHVQQLFTKWDCNQLSNEKFQEQLQALLGGSVDICHEESEFLRLTNKHRAARNLKFAQLMSALRRDAHNTMARRLGRPLCSALPSYAGSAAGGSVYEPSEAGFSEAYSHPAGRPTQGVPPPGSRGGRRHFNTSAGPGSVAGSIQSSGQPTGGYPGVYGQQGAQPGSPSQSLRAAQQRRAEPDPDFWSRTSPSAANQPPRAPAPQQPQGPMPYGVNAVTMQQHDLQQQRLHQDEMRWRQRPSTADAHEVLSVAATDAASVADSQREVFSHRNRSGHGNILTWGGESRDLTPNKRRGGRQQTLDANGVPRVLTGSNGVFPQGR